MTINPKPLADIATSKTVEGPPGIFRTTLAYVDDAMICHFRLKKDAVIPMHEHAAAQVGYLISGRLRFIRPDHIAVTVEPGGSWAFAPHEPHAAEVPEDCEVIECFTPARPEFIDP
jgi:quercetin dioxygenase-like cupin family protein